jgi:hypothetical protein
VLGASNGIYAFKASRCFRKEFNRVILAFSTRIASVFVGFCFGCRAFVTRPIIGVGIIEARATGCVLIGPIIGSFRGMAYNSLLPDSFKRQIPRIGGFPPAQGFASGGSER